MNGRRLSGEALVEARAQHLLRWYPGSWRARYGEEFTDLLVAEIADQPRNLRRTADVAIAGITARLTLAGLGSGPVTAPQAALGTVGVAGTAFAVCGLSLWSQLLVGGQSATPTGRAATVAVVVMSIALACLALLTLLAVLPPAASVIRELASRRSRALVGPALSVTVAIGLLVVGGHHLQSGRPGAGPPTWHLIQLVPGGVASFAWVQTLALTAYWAHPGLLLALPTNQLAWTLLSPMALATAGVAGVRLVRALPWSARSLAFEARLARAAGIAMVPLLLAAAWWVISSYTGPDSVFRAGSLDVALIAVMAIAVAATRTATATVARTGEG